jgi:ornithine--oxo-acid transaminase
VSNTAKHIELNDRYGARNYKPLPVVIAKGEGAWVEDVDGTRYLDMLSAYSALNHGHRHPRIIAALTEQAARCTLTSRAFHNDQLGPFLEELVALCGLDMALPMNSGAEAVETAVKYARRWGYRIKGVAPDKARIIVCSDNFHGRTVTVISFSSEADYRTDFGPFTPGFDIVPYSDAAALEQAITPETVAFLVEPIQGEAGVVVPEAGYLEKVREICDKNRVLLMADEIQTGLGRTGRLFCIDHDGVRPDVLIVGKALGGGVMPISAVIGTREVMELLEPGSHGSTFGGNPLACAVAREAMRVLREEKLVERSAELGEYLMARLSDIKSKHVDHVRGRGLFVGVVLRPEAGGARRFCEKLKAEGLLCKETHENVIRFAPPLVVAKADLDWALERVARVLGEA